MKEFMYHTKVIVSACILAVACAVLDLNFLFWSQFFLVALFCFSYRKKIMELSHDVNYGTTEDLLEHLQCQPERKKEEG